MASDKLCLVLLPPYGEGAPSQDEIKILLDYVIRPAIEKYHFHLLRSDELLHDGDPVPERVIRVVQAADLCIIFLVGSSPELYYLVGRRHESGKPYIHLVKRGDEVLFDFDSTSTVMYDDLASTESAFKTIWTIQKYVDEFERQGYGRVEGGLSMAAVAAITNRIEGKLNQLLEKTNLLPAGWANGASEADFLEIQAIDTPDDLDPAPANSSSRQPSPPPAPAPLVDFADLAEALGSADGDPALDDLASFASNLLEIDEASPEGELYDAQAPDPVNEAASAIEAGDYARAGALIPAIEAHSGISDELLVVASAVAGAGHEIGVEPAIRLLTEHRDGLSREAIRAGMQGVASFYIQTGRQAEGLPRVQAIAREITKAHTDDRSFQADILDQLQRVAYSAGDFARAREICMRTLQLMPSHPDYLFNASRIFDQLGVMSRAVEFVDRYMTASPDGDAERLAHAVSVYARARRVPEARGALAKLSRLDGERARLVTQEPAVRAVVGAG
jgi:tetratricopeptide (TPR) repeat protein